MRDHACGWSQGLDVISAHADWLQPLHQRLGWSWPCPESLGFQTCWTDIEKMLVAADPAEPYYDAKFNVLHWAKELRFSSSTSTSLNYDVRVLGRKGVLTLQAIGDMSQLPEIKSAISAVIRSVEFAKGQQYTDFNPDLDEVAAYGIGGLVAGKVLAKVGALAFMAKFWKIIAAVVAAGWTAIRRFFGGKTADE
jgi:uncharacterized membrane-anchored protein